MSPQEKIFKIIDRLYYENSSDLLEKKIAIAVSGGSDSIALLHILHDWLEKKDIQLICLTVDHNLRQDSKENALFVSNVCKKLSIDCHVLQWNHDRITTCLQEKARNARYYLISEFALQNNISHVFLAHHLDDQIETYLMRKEKYSSEYGLACMSAVTRKNNIFFLRPLLGVGKSYLLKYLQDRKIDWYEDSSNANENFERIRTRNAIKDMNQEKIHEISALIYQHGINRVKTDQIIEDFLQKEVILQYGVAIIDIHKFKDLSIAAQGLIISKIIPIVTNRNLNLHIKHKKINEIVYLEDGEKTLFGHCVFAAFESKLCIYLQNYHISFDNIDYCNYDRSSINPYQILPLGSAYNDVMKLQVDSKTICDTMIHNIDLSNLQSFYAVQTSISDFFMIILQFKKNNVLLNFLAEVFSTWPSLWHDKSLIAIFLPIKGQYMFEFFCNRDAYLQSKESFVPIAPIFPIN